MKKLLLLAALLLPLGVAAQTTNILTIRTTYETITASSTNSAVSQIKYDSSGSKRDQLNLAGVQFAYAAYTNSLATNAVPMSLESWFRTNVIQTVITSYVNQKQASDNAVLAEKINRLLTQQSDLLSNAELNQLATIAAKAQ